MPLLSFIDIFGPYCLDYFLMQNSAEPIRDPETETTFCPLCGSPSGTIIHTFDKLHVSLCGGCGLRYLNPRIKESVMTDRYKCGAYFSGGEKSGYDDYFAQEISLRLTFRRFIRNLRKVIPQAQSLLEIGCGYGFFLDEAKFFFPRLAGVELSAKAGKTAGHNSGASVFVGRADMLPPGMNNFDIIIMINVIEHVYAPVPLLLSLRERLTAGGVIVVATPDIGSLWYRMMKKRWPSFKIPEHVAFYGKKTLGNLLSRAGFQSIGAIPYSHAFPLGLIAEKFGVILPGVFAKKILWLPGVMVALYGRK